MWFQYDNTDFNELRTLLVNAIVGDVSTGGEAVYLKQNLVNLINIGMAVSLQLSQLYSFWNEIKMEEKSVSTFDISSISFFNFFFLKALFLKKNTIQNCFPHIYSIRGLWNLDWKFHSGIILHVPVFAF